MRSRIEPTVIVGSTLATVVLGVYGAGMLYAGLEMPFPISLVPDALAAMAGVAAIGLWVDLLRGRSELPAARVRR